MAHNYHLELQKTTRFDDSTAVAPASQNDSEAQQRLEQTERMAVLMEAMSELPPRQYEVLKMLLLDDDEPSYRQVAERLEMPIASIGPTRTRAMRKLKVILEQKNFKF
jgi:RNA polymerase sigma factor (sigma-70 family)